MEIISTLIGQKELRQTGHLERYITHFGYEHLQKEYLNRWDKYTPAYYITKADPEHNYGLDFKIWILYTAEGIHFFSEMSMGSSSITSGALRRVFFRENIIEFGTQGFDKRQRKSLKLCSEQGVIFN